MSRELHAGREVDTEDEIPCAVCSNRTRHRVLSSFSQPFYEVGGEDDLGEEEKTLIGEVFSEILICEGCDTITFASRRAEHRPDGGIFPPDLAFYPPRPHDRQGISDLYLLPDPVQRIYSETHKALNDQQPLLAAMGIRALVEAVCKEKKAPGDNLKKRISGLVEVGALSRDGADLLHDLRIMGNEAAHEVKAEHEGVLVEAMDIVDHLLQGVFVFPERRRRRQPRNGRK